MENKAALGEEQTYSGTVIVIVNFEVLKDIPSIAKLYLISWSKPGNICNPSLHINQMEVSIALLGMTPYFYYYNLNSILLFLMAYWC